MAREREVAMSDNTMRILRVHNLTFTEELRNPHIMTALAIKGKGQHTPAVFSAIFPQIQDEAMPPVA
eukprot:12189733-Heterocapsa_arctica.AAC.1